MIRRILNKIEEFRGADNIFKKTAVSTKDFLWVLFSHPLNPTIEWNKRWNYYTWEKNGDEWDNQASFCNQPYEKWKLSIVENFIKPNISKESTVLEIAPGRGRWTEFLLDSKKLILVDLNDRCIQSCKKRFLRFKNIEYFTNNGKRLSFIKDNSIDFIFSYDSFVHMEREVIDSYFREFHRILKKHGKAIIHHPDRRNILFYKTNKRMAEGARADISKDNIKKLAKKNNLKVNFQIDSWGKNKEYNCKAHGDCISEIIKK